MSTLPHGELQLVGVTAMWIACKYEEINAPSILDFAYITADLYTLDQIKAMEIEVLKTLGYSLGAPIPLQFLRRYSRMAGVSHNV
jgi:hypothetical protein